MGCSTVSISKWRDCFKSERTRLVTSCIAVFFWGLIAHAYGFLNLTISHDSLKGFFASKGNILHRIELGRFMVPIYQIVFHGRVTLPWLNGLLALCWLSISVWLVARIFAITDKFRIALIAGIFTVNISVTALSATYIHDLDADMFAVMLAVIMVLLWQRGGKCVWLGVPLLVLVLGFYQSMLSVAITLIMFISILALLRGDRAVDVIKKGVLAIGIIIIAGIIYLLVAKLSCLIADIEMLSGYNGLTNLFASKGNLPQIGKLVLKTYYRCFAVFIHSARSFYEMLLLHISLFIPMAITVVYAMLIKSLSTQNKILVLVLGALLPMGMNISCLADGGMVHDLMLYAAWLAYFLAILLTRWYADLTNSSKKLAMIYQAITYCVLILILITNVQTSNSAYIKKDLDRQATLSTMTTVAAQMNNTEDYVAGETEVVFVGIPRTNTAEIFPNLNRRIVGMAGSPITYDETYGSYFRYILQTPLLQSKTEIPVSITDSMAAFPEVGYIQWYKDILVVKLSD